MQWQNGVHWEKLCRNHKLVAIMNVVAFHNVIYKWLGCLFVWIVRSFRLPWNRYFMRRGNEKIKNESKIEQNIFGRSTGSTCMQFASHTLHKQQYSIFHALKMNTGCLCISEMQTRAPCKRKIAVLHFFFFQKNFKITEIIMKNPNQKITIRWFQFE